MSFNRDLHKVDHSDDRGLADSAEIDTSISTSDGAIESMSISSSLSNSISISEATYIDEEHLGQIDASHVKDYQRAILKTFIEEAGIASGASIDAGEHDFITYDDDAEGNIKYTVDFTTGFTFVGEVDPGTFTGRQKKIIKALLRNGGYQSGDYVPSDYYTAVIKNNDHDELVGFKLSKDIIVRSKVPGTLYYDVLAGTSLGEGSFGSVKDVVGTIKPRFADKKKRKLQFVAKSNRVAKIQEHDNSDEGEVWQRTDAANAEFNIMSRDVDFAPKGMSKIEYDEDEIVSAFTMRKFDGGNLNALLHAVNDGNLHMSEQDRYIISIELLHALRQVHALDVVHRDIKPENIIVTHHPDAALAADRWSVKIVDFGLACEKGNSFGRSCGTIYYVAPEVFKGQADQASDMYSMAKILGFVWGDRVIVADLEKTEEEYHQSWSNNKFEFKIEPFNGVNLTDTQQIEVSQIIYKLADIRSAKDNSKRNKDYYAAMVQMERAYFNYKYANIGTKTPEYKQLSLAHYAAIGLRDVLDNLTASDLPMLEEKFKVALEGVVEKPSVVREFAQTLGVRCLFGSESKQQLLAKVSGTVLKASLLVKESHHLIDKLKSAYTANKNCISQAEKVRDLKQYLRELCVFEVKLDKLPVSLDRLERFNEKVSHKNERIVKSFGYFNSLFPDHGDSDADSHDRGRVCF